MLFQTRGIVFHSVKYSETSLVCKILTEQFGLQSYLVNGVRKNQGRAGLLQPLMMLDLTVYHRDNKSLQRIREFGPAYVYADLPFNILKSTTGLFLLEVLQRCIRSEAVDEPLFGYIFEQLQALDRASGPVADFHLSFLTGLSPYLGFGMYGQYDVHHPVFDLRSGTFTDRVPPHAHYAEGNLARVISGLLHATSGAPPLDHATRQRTRELLLSFYGLHAENFHSLKSVRILEEVLKP